MSKELVDAGRYLLNVLRDNTEPVDLSSVQARAHSTLNGNLYSVPTESIDRPLARFEKQLQAELPALQLLAARVNCVDVQEQKKRQLPLEKLAQELENVLGACRQDDGRISKYIMVRLELRFFHEFDAELARITPPPITIIRPQPRPEAYLHFSPVASGEPSTATLYAANSRQPVTEAPQEAGSVPATTKGTAGVLADVSSKMPVEIDYAGIVKKLRMERKGNPANLVEFMKDRDTATSQEVADEVHKYSETANNAIAMNVSRTNDALAKMGERLSFCFASSVLYKEISAM